MLLPLGGDKGGHRYRPIASSTQRATERLSTSRCIRSSVTSSVQPHQLGALVLAQRRVAVLPPAALAGAPVAQRALVDPQIPGHLRDLLAGLEHQLHRTMLEVRIELPVLPAHRSSSKRCLHATRGSPRVVVLNVRVWLIRRPPGPAGVRRQTVSDALPMSSPATRSNSTSTTTTSSRVDGRWTPSGGSSARTQTHALAAAIKGTRGPRAIHLNGLARASVFRRRRTTRQFSSPRAANQDRKPIHLMHPGSVVPS